MSSQTINGKAFEYALIRCFYENLKDKTNVVINKSNEYFKKLSCLSSQDFIIIISDLRFSKGKIKKKK